MMKIYKKLIKQSFKKIIEDKVLNHKKLNIILTICFR